MNTWEIVGASFGLVYVLLAIKAHPACWIAAILSACAYIPTFIHARLYMESALQVFFIVLSAYGFFAWRSEQSTSPVLFRVGSGKENILLVTISIVLGYLISIPLATYLPASYPLLDSTITVMSIAATYVQAKKRIENWIYWIAINLVSIMVYSLKGLNLTALLYSFYLALAVAGLLTWSRARASRFAHLPTGRH